MGMGPDRLKHLLQTGPRSLPKLLLKAYPRKVLYPARIHCDNTFWGKTEKKKMMAADGQKGHIPAMKMM